MPLLDQPGLIGFMSFLIYRLRYLDITKVSVVLHVSCNFYTAAEAP